MWTVGGNWTSGRNVGKTIKSWFPSVIPAWDCRRSRWTGYLMRSLPPNLTVLAWGYPSAVLLLNRMAAGCGLLTTLRAAHAFVLLCPPKLRQMNEAHRHSHSVRH